VQDLYKWSERGSEKLLTHPMFILPLSKMQSWNSNPIGISDNKDNFCNYNVNFFTDFYFEKVRNGACIQSCAIMAVYFGYPFVDQHTLESKAFIKMYFKSSIKVRRSSIAYRYFNLKQLESKSIKVSKIIWFFSAFCHWLLSWVVLWGFFLASLV